MSGVSHERITEIGREHVLEKPVLRVNSTMYAVPVLIALTAAWMSAGRFLTLEHADSLVLALISLQHWSPFYWESNRYGMLVPLLAKPFHDPLTNLIVQAALTILAGLAASFLLIRYFFEDSNGWLVAAALQNVWLLLLVPKPVQFGWLVNDCYGVSLALGFAGLIFLSKRRIVLSLLLLLLAHWVNCMVFLVLMPLALGHHLVHNGIARKKDLFLSLGAIAAAAAVGLILLRTSHYHDTVTGLLPPGAWFDSWKQILHKIRKDVLPTSLLVSSILIPAALGLVALILTRSKKYVISVCSILTFSALLQFLVVGTAAHVRANFYLPRYVFPSLLVVATAMALLTVAPYEDALRRSRFSAVAAAAVMFIAAAIVYGPPSVSLVRQDINRRFGSATAEILANHASVVAGNYWTVWPIVFDVNMVLYERGDHRMVYGLSYRFRETSNAWLNQRPLCLAVPLHDQDAQFQMSATGLQFQQMTESGTVDIFCAR